MSQKEIKQIDRSIENLQDAIKKLNERKQEIILSNYTGSDPVIDWGEEFAKCVKNPLYFWRNYCVVVRVSGEKHHFYPPEIATDEEVKEILSKKKEHKFHCSQVYCNRVRGDKLPFERCEEQCETCKAIVEVSKKNFEKK